MKQQTTLMNTALKIDPLTYEFDTQEEAESYDAWFRAKVQKALDSKEPPIPHDEVVAKIRAKLAERAGNAC